MGPRLRAYLYLILVSFIWGVAAVVIKLTLKGIDPLPFLTYRFAISAIIGLIFILNKKETLKKLFADKELFLTAILYSLLATSVALGFLFWGLGKTTVLNLSLIDLTAPIIVAIFGVIFLREHITKQEKIGSAIALIGAILILIGPGFFQSKLGASILGNLFILLYVTTDAASSLFLKKLIRKKFDVLFLVNFSFIIGFLSMLPITLIKYSPLNLIHMIIALPLPYQAGVWFMAVISGSFAYFLRGLGQKTIEIGEAGLFAYLISVFSAPLAVLVLGEKPSVAFIIGSVVVVAGIIIAEIRKKRV